MKNSTEKASGYTHIQRAPLCLVLYALAALFLFIGIAIVDQPPMRWGFPFVALVLVLLAGSFHYLAVVDLGDVLAVQFGPVPLFRTCVRYNEIDSVQAGQTLLLDGWGIHMSVRGGWVWNIWGRDCVIVKFRNGSTLRIGTDDALRLTEFLKQKIH